MLKGWRKVIIVLVLKGKGSRNDYNTAIDNEGVSNEKMIIIDEIVGNEQRVTRKGKDVMTRCLHRE